MNNTNQFNPFQSSNANPFQPNNASQPSNPNPFQSSNANPFQPNNASQPSNAFQPNSSNLFQPNNTFQPSNPFQSNNAFQGNNTMNSPSNNLFQPSNVNSFQPNNNANQSQMNNNVNQFTQECPLVNVLNSLENSYNPNSTEYKFNQVFYNILTHSNFVKPNDFPNDLWLKYFIPNSNLFPVILNKIQIEERKEQQNDLIKKLSESSGTIGRKVENLKIKREMVKNKLEKLIEKFKKKVKSFVICEEINFKVSTEILVEREKFNCKNKEEVCEYLQKMNEKLIEFERRVNEQFFKRA
jgi:hypothetical protein